MGRTIRFVDGEEASVIALNPNAIQTKTTAVADALRHYILSERPPAGTPLLQEQVAAKLGVSATPVREAFALLEAEGLLQRRPHRGVVVAAVTPISKWERQLTQEVRSLLEGHAIDRLLAGEHSDILRALTEHAAASEEIPRDGRVAVLRKSASDFHVLLGSAVGSEVHYQTLLNLANRILLFPFEQSMGQLELSLKSHIDLVDAINARDADGAKSVWANHLRFGNDLTQLHSEIETESAQH